MVGRVLFAAALCAGCRYGGTFMCETNEQCRHGTTPGRCEPVGYCSFPDGACTSGFRFDDNSGAGYASACVGDETPPDAAIDAVPDAAFDVAQCPRSTFNNYNIQIASSPSRYRLVVGTGTFWAHEGLCASGLPGKTHLVIPDNVQEIVELSEYIDPLSNTGAFFYVGAVQNPIATTPAEGWIRFDGVPLDPAVWRLGDPEDLDGSEADHSTQLAVFDKSASVERMDDTRGTTAYGSVCECDGKAMSPQARTFVDSDPNNPN